MSDTAESPRPALVPVEAEPAERARRDLAERVAHTPAFSREQVELIKRTVAQGVTDDELHLFLETARRRGLDPFTGQIHAVRRWDSRENRKVMRIQTGIDGYRAIADRTGLVELVAGPEWTGDGRTWVEVWLSDEPPQAARFTVKRRDRSAAETRVATWREYAQRDQKGNLTPTWQSLPATMLGKVAEAAALRAALPEHLGGIYTADEMDQADTPHPAASGAEDAVVVDHVEERRALFARYGDAYRSVREAEGEQAALEAHRDARQGWYGHSVEDAFDATPLHVLEASVAAMEWRAAAHTDPGDADDHGAAVDVGDWPGAPGPTPPSDGGTAATTPADGRDVDADSRSDPAPVGDTASALSGDPGASQRDDDAGGERVSPGTRRALMAACRQQGMSDMLRHAIMAAVYHVDSSNDLSEADARDMIDLVGDDHRRKAALALAEAVATRTHDADDPDPDEA